MAAMESLDRSSPSSPPGITAPELRRQLVHASIGAFALLLRWLTTWQAAGVALVALFANFFVLPRTSFGSSMLREGEGRFGGTVVYPFVVAVLVLVLPLHLAAAAWVILAVGDAASNVCGRTMGRSKLAWNVRKSWAGTLGFALFATPAAALALMLVVPGQETAPHAEHLTWGMAFLLAAAAACAAAIVESLPLRIDDNLTVGLSSALVLWVMHALLFVEV